MAIHIECKKRDRSIIFINGNELIVEGRTDLKVNGWTVRLNDVKLKIKIKSVAYSSQGRHTGQLDFCN